MVLRDYALATDAENPTITVGAIAASLISFVLTYDCLAIPAVRYRPRRNPVKMIRRIIKAILILASLAAIGWWSVQNDDDTPRGKPRGGELSSVPYGLG